VISRTPVKSGPECAKLLRIDYNPIRNCANGEEGKYLHYFAGKRTDALQPPHEGVPWIIFNNVYNGKEMDEARTNLLGFLCKKISGPKPPVCANYIM
jgi:interferon gamma-inducible protein 30